MCSAYSQEEGTVAAEMENQIPEETKEERRDIIMDIQKSIAAALCEKEVGKVMEVLIEGKLPEEIFSVAEQEGMPPKLTAWICFLGGGAVFR